MALYVEGVSHSKHLIELTAIEMLVCQRYGMDHFGAPLSAQGPIPAADVTYWQVCIRFFGVAT